MSGVCSSCALQHPSSEHCSDDHSVMLTSRHHYVCHVVLFRAGRFHCNIRNDLLCGNCTFPRILLASATNWLRRSADRTRNEGIHQTASWHERLACCCSRWEVVVASDRPRLPRCSVRISAAARRHRLQDPTCALYSTPTVLSVAQSCVRLDFRFQASEEGVRRDFCT